MVYVILEKGGSMPKPPAPPAPPRLTDAATSNAAGLPRKRRGFGSTMLTGGLGIPGGDAGSRTLLGG
jgi:hypothetical protein